MASQGESLRPMLEAINAMRAAGTRRTTFRRWSPRPPNAPTAILFTPTPTATARTATA